jgi:SAM-dependent methyltransferase
MQHVRAMQTKYGLGRNITQRLGDARQLPYPDNSFDKVFSISVMEHLSNNHLQALTELVRVLKPGGKLLLTMDVNLGSPTSDFHLGVGSVGGLLKELGLEMPHNGPTKSIIMGTAHLVVILVCWEKPKEGIANKSGDV